MLNPIPHHSTSIPLTAAQEAQLELFLKKTIRHPHMDRAVEEIKNAIWNKSHANLVIVTGPTGVGKTTLAHKLEQFILEHEQGTRQAHPGHIPVVHLSAVSPGCKAFNWKDFYIRLLNQLDSCSPQMKLPFAMDSFRYLDQPMRLHREAPTASSLERAVEGAIRHRKVRYIIVDEANLILLGAHAKELRSQFETIKSLSIQTNAVIILVGTYDLQEIRNQSAQLIRRSRILQFPRYDWGTPFDREAFSGALNTFLKFLPCEVSPDLAEAVEFFYLKSAGCVGILKRWLDVSVETAMRAGCTCLDRDWVERHAHDNRSIATILSEAFEGERQLRDISLGQIKNMLTRHHKEMKNQGASEGEGLDQYFGKPRQKRTVGTRRAQRDAVGGNLDLFAGQERGK
nr:ATP-binding protein [Paludibacterium sp. B53371]